MSRIFPPVRSAVRVIARLGGGPNGAAMGPAGKIYVTNNGGLKFVERPGKLFTANESLLVSQVGVLTDERFTALIAALIDLLQA